MEKRKRERNKVAMATLEQISYGGGVFFITAPSDVSILLLLFKLGTE